MTLSQPSLKELLPLDILPVKKRGRPSKKNKAVYTENRYNLRDPDELIEAQKTWQVGRCSGMQCKDNDGLSKLWRGPKESFDQYSGGLPNQSSVFYHYDFLSWNVRRINNPIKYNAIRYSYVIMKNKAEVAGLTETKLLDCSHARINSL